MSSRRTWTAKRAMRATILTGFLASQIIPAAVAQPSGGNVVAGQGSITQTGTHTQIDQGSGRLIIEWDSFDTSTQDTVRFVQPGRDAIALNRVLSGQATQFDGSLFANGNVIIVNGAGIHFGATSIVDVGGLIASTSDITNNNFLSDRFIFDQPGLSDAMVTNAGTITARDAGLAALVGPGVENSGLIRAELGTVILASGEAHTIDFRGDGLISFAITSPTTTTPRREDGSEAEALVENSGIVEADGGSVVMTASQASRVLDTAINMTGVAQANSVGVRNGRIVLGGGGSGQVRVSGQVSARGATAGTQGGTVHVTGEELSTESARIDASGVDGGGTVLIGGSERNQGLNGSSDIAYVQAGDLLTILLGENAGAAGDGFMPTADVTYVDAGTAISADATVNGDGGEVILWADRNTYFDGMISARGGAEAGNGGFIETSAGAQLGVGGSASVDARAPNGLVGDWLLDPRTVIVQAGGTATLDQIADANDTTSDLTVDPSTINNAMANVSIVASETITFADSVAMTNDGVGLTATANNNITFNASVATNNGDITLISDSFSIGAAVNAGTGTILIDRATPGNFDGVTAAGLFPAELGRLTAGSLIIGNPIAADNNMNRLDIRFTGGVVDLSSNISGLVQFNALNNAGSFISLGSNADLTAQSIELNANDGVTAFTAPRLTTTSGDIVLNADADRTGILNGFDVLEITNDSDAFFTSGGDIVVITPRIREVNGGQFNFIADNGTITFQRSTSGTMGVGDGATGDFSFTDDQLSRMTADAINFGNPTQIDNLVTGINVAGVDLLTDVSFNAQADATIAFSGENSFGSVVSVGGTTTVETNATVTANGLLTFNTATVNLDGDLTAANGITGTATTVNVIGSTGGAELQDAVDVAAAGATVNVGAGSYDSFLIDKADLTVSGVGAATIVNAASPAITVAANGTIVQNMLLQGTGTAGDIGILLDGTAAPDLTGVQIIDVDFADLDDGVRSQGNIGDGIAANVDVTIRGTSAAAPAIFEDFLDAAIDVGDTDGDAVYLVQDVIVRDGDADGVATENDGFRFGTVGGITINRVDISDATNDGVQVGALDGASVTISNSSILGMGDGIEFAGAISGSQVSIADNAQVEGFDGDGVRATGGILGTSEFSIIGNTTVRGIVSGINLQGSVINSALTIADNATIRGARLDGITLRGASDSTIVIAQNEQILGEGFGGIFVVDNLIDSEVIIGQATATIDGTATAFGGNGDIIGVVNGVTVDGITGGGVTIANNDLIQGQFAFGIFADDITSDALFAVVGNTEIRGGDGGGVIDFDNGISINSADMSTIAIAGNDEIVGNGNAGILVTGSLTDTDFTIGTASVLIDGVLTQFGGNELIRGSTHGVIFEDTITDSKVAITGNTAIAAVNTAINIEGAVEGNTDITITDNVVGSLTSRVGEDGIAFRGGVLDTSTITLDANQVFATEQAIQIDDLQSPSTVSIVGGTYNGTGGALLVDNRGVPGSNGRLNIGSAAYVGGAGSTVLQVLTDAGNAGVVLDFAGGATFDGGATGMHLSGPGIDIDGDTLGSIAFTGQTGNYITLANGAEFQPGTPTIIDAKGVSFDGVLGSELTTADAFAFENRLVHYLDDPTLGLLNTGSPLVVPDGNSIQLAVNAAGFMGGTQTVAVGAGTFGGSIEVWVDDLTLIGQGETTIIDTNAVDAFANNGDVNNGFQVATASALSGGGGVTGVTIDGFRFQGGGATNTVGILLDGRNSTSGSALSNITIGDTIGNTFADRLGTGVLALGDVDSVSISSNTFGLNDGAAGDQNDANRITRGIVSRVDRSGNSVIDGAGNVLGQNDQGPFSDWSITDNTFNLRSFASTNGTAIDLEGVSGSAVDGFAISGNTINNSTFGIHVVGAGGPGSGSPYPLSNNVLIQNNVINGLVSRGIGIRVGANIDSISPNNDRSRMSGITIAGNTVNNTDTGIDVTGVTFMTMSDIVIDNNTINNTDVRGIRLNITGRIRANDPNWTGFVISNNDVNLGANGIGLLIDYSLNSQVAIGSGNTFDGGVNGIVVNGRSGRTLGLVGNTLNNTVFTNQSGNYVELQDTALFSPGSPTIIDATGVRFDGVLGSALTTAEAFAVENKLVHYLDDPTLGLLDFGHLVVPDASSIQLAVNAAGFLGGVRTVTVGAGTFGGSVEVWVDDLTLVGQGATTIIDTDAVDAFANNGDVNNGFQVAAISVLSGGGDVTGVTIDGFTFDTISTTGTNTGIELGEAGVSTAANATVQTSSFTDLLDGIVAHAVTGTTTLSGVMMTDIADNGIRFDSALAADDTVVIADASILARIDAVRFASSLTGTSVTITGSTLEGEGDGIEFSGAIGGGSQVTIAGNQRIEGLDTFNDEDELGDGIVFRGAISGATTNLLIDDNRLIRGDDRGISFASSGNGGPATVTDASVTISRNDEIRGTDIDGILFNADLTNATIVIGGPTATDSNGLIIGGDDGIDIENVDGGSFTIANNTRIEGVTLDGIEFEGPISNGATVTVSDNATIEGDNNGILFDNSINDSTITVAGNADIRGLTLNGIEFDGPISNGAVVTVNGNATIEGDDNGIVFENSINDGTITIAGNTTGILGMTLNGIDFQGPVSDGAVVMVGGNAMIQGDDNGIIFRNTITDSTVAIAGNQEIRGFGVDGIAFDSASNSTIAITGNTGIYGDGFDGIFVENDLVDSTVTISGNNTVVGAENGINVGDIIGGSLAITSNDLIEGMNADGISTGLLFAGADLSISDNKNIIGGDDGVTILGAIGANTVTIDRNDQIRGDDNGISTLGTIGGSIAITNNLGISGGVNGIAMLGAIAGSLEVSGNTEIRGDTEDGILVALGLIGSDFSISANETIIGGDDGINIGAILGGSFTVNDNDLISGTAGSGMEFEGPVSNVATFVIDTNAITGGEEAIEFDTPATITDSMLAFSNNNLQAGTDGMLFDGLVTNSTITTTQNDIVAGLNGINFANLGGGVSFGVDTSNVSGGQAGLTITGSNAGGGQSTIVLGQSAFEGQAGAGVSITTQAGGSGITTDFQPGATMTGAPSLALSGPNQAIAGNTIENASFNSVGGGNFIVLANGALFEPGRPTIIRGIGARFDGERITHNTSFQTIERIESRIVDFDDDRTLGQIFLNLPYLFDYGVDGPVRVTNVQTPGDWMLRPDHTFQILATNPLTGDYGLGTCLLEVSETGDLPMPRCITPAGDFDPSPSIMRFMEGMEQLSALQ